MKGITVNFLFTKTNRTKMSTINVANAKNAHKAASPETKKVLELLLPDLLQRPVVERIQGWNDVLIETNTDSAKFEKANEGLEPYEIAYRRCTLIIKAYNEGQKVDFTNGNQPKFRGVFDFSSGFSLYDSGYTRTGTTCGARLSFLNDDHVRPAFNLFKEDFEVLMNG